MNIENIAVGIKDAHGLDMSDESAITLLRHALSKLAEQAGEPVALVTQALGVAIGDQDEMPLGTKLYTETQLIAAHQKAAEACAKLAASSNANGSMRFTHREEILEALSNGEWMEYM